MNVADLFKKRFFPDFSLVAGSLGLSREISSVSVMDSPDMDQWLRGGEFAIGNGYMFKDNPEAFVSFFERLHARNAAAVGMKFGRFHNELSVEALATADRLALPVIEIPILYRWTDIIDVVYGFLYAEKNSTAQTSWSAGWSVEKGLSELARELGRDILVDCPQLEVRTMLFSAGGQISRENDLYLRLTAARIVELPLPKNEHGAKHLLLVGGEPSFHVVRYATVYRNVPIELSLFLKKGEDMPSLRQERLVDRTFALLKLEISEQGTSPSKPGMQRFLEYLCLGIFYGDESITESNARKYGTKIEFPCRIVLSRYKDGHGSQGMPQIEKYYWNKNVCVGLLEASSGRGELDAFIAGEGFRRYVAGTQAHVAVGTTAKTFSDIERSYKEAWQVLNLIRELRLPSGVYEHNSFSLFGILTNLSSSSWARDLQNTYWQPLSHHSARNCMSMDAFAASLICADYNLKKVSGDLHIHYNTARKYMERLEALLDLDLGRAACRLVLSLAWHAHLAMHDRPRLLQNIQGNEPRDERESERKKLRKDSFPD